MDLFLSKKDSEKHYRNIVKIFLKFSDFQFVQRNLNVPIFVLYRKSTEGRRQNCDSEMGNVQNVRRVSFELKFNRPLQGSVLEH